MPATPPLAITFRPVTSPKREVASTLTPLNMPSRLMSVKITCCTPKRMHLMAQIHRIDPACLLPPVCRNLAIACVDADGDTLGPPAQQCIGDKIPIFYRHSTEHNAIRAQFQRQLDVLHRTQARRQTGSARSRPAGSRASGAD